MAIYMNFNSKKPAGNVTAKGYEDWIEVDSFSFGVGRSITMEAGAMSNREAGRPSLSEVSVTKLLDAASGGLFKESVTGSEGTTVQIDIVQTGTNTVQKYASYTLEDCMVSSYSIGASAGGAPTETISLSFAKIVADLSHADKTHKNKKNLKVGYDLTTAEPL
ncbi:Hcp family type VI secretion system effector [Endozoicomonas numazuensis]|uniref:Hemolysin-coregulated protein n=1 Tax=Endozoicomonas numazuensis TaxID=1137799 RepID=A0A081N1B9_9GAMM|nr:type VI secretion system tube protein Hcp [Endozoicomonas numazuensis]KEQ12242.1 hemolysin-coregulated protein [Endozoicomonas numazuensis]